LIYAKNPTRIFSYFTLLASIPKLRIEGIKAQSNIHLAGRPILQGFIIYIFRRQFLLISIDPTGAQAKGLRIGFWDFLFYASFGFAVTSSVAVAGVLLLFCYLVVPSVAAMLFVEGIAPRLPLVGPWQLSYRRWAYFYPSCSTFRPARQL
jgi:hypothetical protein